MNGKRPRHFGVNNYYKTDSQCLDSCLFIALIFFIVIFVFFLPALIAVAAEFITHYSF